MKEKTRQRLEEDGLYESTLDHWELLENVIFSTNPAGSGFIYIPKDIGRHLGLERGDRLTIAIHHTVSRREEKIELKPANLGLINSVRPRRHNTLETIIKTFLASEHLKVELDPGLYDSVSRYLVRHKECPISAHCLRYRTPGMYSWLERKEVDVQ